MQVSERTDHALRQAIAQKHLVRFWYNGQERISEPHDYGLQRGRARLMTYQIGGQSNSGVLPAWRWIDVEKMQNLEILPETFPGSRTPLSGKHHKWDEVFIRVA